MGDGDIVYVQLVPLDEEQEQVEGALEVGEVDGVTQREGDLQGTIYKLPFTIGLHGLVGEYRKDPFQPLPVYGIEAGLLGTVHVEDAQ